jgi:hypothetical protein
VIAILHAGHAAADIDHDAGAFMAEDRREQSFGIGAGQREFIGVADADGLDFDQHFASRGPSSCTVDISSGLPAATATAARTSMS